MKHTIERQGRVIHDYSGGIAVPIHQGDTAVLVSKRHRKAYVAVGSCGDGCAGCVFERGRACYHYPFTCVGIVLKPVSDLLEDL